MDALRRLARDARRRSLLRASSSSSTSSAPPGLRPRASCSCSREMGGASARGVALMTDNWGTTRREGDRVGAREAGRESESCDHVTRRALASETTLSVRRSCSCSRSGGGRCACREEASSAAAACATFAAAVPSARSVPSRSPLQLLKTRSQRRGVRVVRIARAPAQTRRTPMGNIRARHAPAHALRPRLEGVVVEVLREERKVDEAKVGGEVGLERELVREQTPDQVRDIAYIRRKRQRAPEAWSAPSSQLIRKGSARPSALSLRQFTISCLPRVRQFAAYRTRLRLRELRAEPACDGRVPEPHAHSVPHRAHRRRRRRGRNGEEKRNGASGRIRMSLAACLPPPATTLT